MSFVREDREGILAIEEYIDIDSFISAFVKMTSRGFVILDHKGYVITCNDEIEELLDIKKDHIINRHITEYLSSINTLNALKNELGYSEVEEIWRGKNNSIKVIASFQPFHSNSIIKGFIISIKNLEKPCHKVNGGNSKRGRFTFNDIIGRSEEVLKIKQQAMQFSNSNSTILITGESGTGKEVFARAIHDASLRCQEPFVYLNCGAIPELLIESELFGYEEGAFTGASIKGKIGKFELANNGTIFLDEIGDMPMHLQVKMLHAIQNMEFEKVGGNKSIKVDVRIIAATNRNLVECVKDGTFREDLYYRLNVIPLEIPPLRERREDIPLLINCFIRKYNAVMNKKIKGITKQVQYLYANYDWPGNVRQLENVIEYSMNLVTDGLITIDQIPPMFGRINVPDCVKLDLRSQIKDFERKLIKGRLRFYESMGLEKENVAQELGISRATLYRKLESLGIN